MNYNQYYSVDVINGPGTRCTLFVSGCEHKCKGCYNVKTWRVDSGLPFTQQAEDTIIADLMDSRIPRQGLSLSGGDPLHPNNLDAIEHLVCRVKDECPGKDIWMWTGYEFDELNEQQQRIIEMVDVLIDGKFVQELADPSLQWKGSSNQKVIMLTQLCEA